MLVYHYCIIQEWLTFPFKHTWDLSLPLGGAMISEANFQAV